MQPRSHRSVIRFQPAVQQRHRRCSGRFPKRAPFSAMSAIIACTLSSPSPTSAQANQPQTELNLTSYESELDRIAESLKRPEQIAQLRKSLPPAWPVRVDDKSVRVPTDWLASGLKELEEQPAKSASGSRELTSRLIAMRKAAAAFEHGPNLANLEAAHTQLDKI